MKVCEQCGIEIDGKDGDNLCPRCDDLQMSGLQSSIYSEQHRANKRKAARAKQRRERDDAMRSLGMVKVRGAMGGTYWE